MMRYSLLPLWYTTFFEAYETGAPVMRAMFVEFPDQPEMFTVEDQWLIGSSLLVKPVVDSGVKSVSVTFPKVEDNCNSGTTLPWYEYESLKAMSVHSGHVNYPVELSTIPLFLRPGNADSTFNKKRVLLLL
jgi:alpha-glucosidase (family GH31 glycosyl hydrolase)